MDGYRTERGEIRPLTIARPRFRATPGAYYVVATDFTVCKSEQLTAAWVEKMNV